MFTLQVLNDELERVLSQAKLTSKVVGFCIGNTIKRSGIEARITPIRETEKLVAGSVIVESAEIASKIAKFLDGKVDYLLVDVEKKISREAYGDADIGNVERAVREVISISKILTYKGNDITVDSIEELIKIKKSTNIRGLSGLKATIIGSGNIGSKLALRLVEQGVNVFLVRRDKDKLSLIVDSINQIKPGETVAGVIGTTDHILAADRANILIGCTSTPSINKLTLKMLDANPLLIDVGKGSFDNDAVDYAQNENLTIYRQDIRVGFEAAVSKAMSASEILSSMGRKIQDDVALVTMGVLGVYGDIVVNCINKPSIVYGVADGKGEFLPRDSDAEKLFINKLRASEKK